MTCHVYAAYYKNIKGRSAYVEWHASELSIAYWVVIMRHFYKPIHRMGMHPATNISVRSFLSPVLLSILQLLENCVQFWRDVQAYRAFFTSDWFNTEVVRHKAMVSGR